MVNHSRSMRRIGSTRSRRLRGEGGFTLVELIAIVVIVSILAGVAVPAMTNLDDSRGAAAGKQLLKDLTFARQRAVATGHRCWVVFDAPGDAWSILAEDPQNPGRSSAASVTDLATGRAYDISLAQDFTGVTISSADFDGGDEIGFDWLGRPFVNDSTELAADGSLTLNTGHVVRVAARTGHVWFEAP